MRMFKTQNVSVVLDTTLLPTDWIRPNTHPEREDLSPRLTSSRSTHGEQVFKRIVSVSGESEEGRKIGLLSFSDQHLHVQPVAPHFTEGQWTDR